jgi:hypothetical protein
MGRWQHGQGLRARMPEPAHRPVGEEIEIGNEFAFVRVRKVLTRNGERLEIIAPRLGYAIQLDPLELEALSWQTHDSFSRLLSSSGGPDHDQAPPHER